MARSGRANDGVLLFSIALAGWAEPGAGYWILKEYKRAVIIFLAIALLFCIGTYVGSIGVVSSVSQTPGILGTFNPWFAAQILNTPLVYLIARATAAGAYPVYGKPAEIGQLYTSISRLLNLLCIISSVYLAHVRSIGNSEE